MSMSMPIASVNPASGPLNARLRSDDSDAPLRVLYESLLWIKNRDAGTGKSEKPSP